MTGPYSDASVQLPAGFNELPGFDPHWETFPAHTEQSIHGATVLNELTLPVGAGESLSWEAFVVIGGAPDGSATLTVLTPPNPNGGFLHEGTDSAGDWQANNYGGDDFNTSVGDLRTGVSGTLRGFDVHSLTGLYMAGSAPGLIRIRLNGPSGAYMMPCSHIRGYRIFDARKNEVGA